MSEDYKELCVVIPTRNRADLAIGAARSVLSQTGLNIKVLISDNSTSAVHSAKLSKFSRQLDDRLQYVSAPEPKSMSTHWGWALEKALEGAASHFTFLTDRMIFRPDELRRVIDVVKRHPAKIISYKHDRVVDYKMPVTLTLHDFTGKLFEVDASRLLYLTSQSTLHESLPRMLNCVAPRSVLERIRERFGSVFSSNAPDFNFCYRALALEDTILFFDKALLIHRALDLSAGQTAARGIVNDTLADFMANLVQEQWNFAAPVPELSTTFNAIIHEYCYVKQESMSSRFPDVDVDKYLAFIASELKDFENDEMKGQLQEILTSRGWGQNAADDKKVSVIRRLSPSVLRTKLLLTVASARTKPFWLFLERHLGVRPPDINRFEFDTSDEALNYALEFPRRGRDSIPNEESLLEATSLRDSVCARKPICRNRH